MFLQILEHILCKTFSIFTYMVWRDPMNFQSNWDNASQRSAIPNMTARLNTLYDIVLTVYVFEKLG